MPLLNCDHCGRFTVGADSYTNWGHAGMDEPPDPIILCSACHEGEYQRYLGGLLKRGIPPNDARPTWQSSLAWVRAKGVARGMFKHGTPRPVMHTHARTAYDSLRAWFCACGRPERHPAHDPVEARRLNVPHCRFEKRVGKPLRPSRTRSWCVCGWSTGWRPVGDSPSFIDPIGEHLDEGDPSRRTRLQALMGVAS